MAQSEKEALVTETVNLNTINIDRMEIIDVVNVMNEEDQKVARAVKKEIPRISKAIEMVVDHLNKGGRLFYIGAGTSGRIGVLDASECPPTFNTPPGLVNGIIAGGDIALRNALEGVEDSRQKAKEDLLEHGFDTKDVLIGLAASGTTPYVLGALEYANSKNASTISVSCNGNTLISEVAQLPIEIIVGPEVIMGSTRLKAATAQKMVLNMISTATMVQLGKVYQNLMVDLQAKNEKLKKRAINIVRKVTSCDEVKAKKLLGQTEWRVKEAIIICETGASFQEAQQFLSACKGRVGEAAELARNA